MLRINLLPIRRLKEQAQARSQLQIFCSALIFLLLILLTISLIQSSKVRTLKRAISQIQQEHEQYQPILKQINDLKKAKKELENKIEVIRALDQESSLTVHILDEVARQVDSSRMWLTSLNQQGGSLNLTGVALDNRTIATFMDALGTSPYISVVNLSNASLQRVAGRNLKSFALQCSVLVPKEQDSAENKKPEAP